MPLNKILLLIICVIAAAGLTVSVVAMSGVAIGPWAILLVLGLRAFVARTNHDV